MRIETFQTFKRRRSIVVAPRKPILELMKELGYNIVVTKPYNGEKPSACVKDTIKLMSIAYNSYVYYLQENDKKDKKRTLIIWGKPSMVA